MEGGGTSTAASILLPAVVGAVRGLDGGFEHRGSRRDAVGCFSAARPPNRPGEPPEPPRVGELK